MSELPRDVLIASALTVIDMPAFSTLEQTSKAIDLMARAILEERERCARIVDEFYDHVPDALRDAQDMHLVQAQRLIAKAIRAS